MFAIVEGLIGRRGGLLGTNLEFVGSEGYKGKETDSEEINIMHAGGKGTRCLQKVRFYNLRTI